MNALLGRKIGMTSVFQEDGSQVPVTVIEVGPCQVVQRKTSERDGYEAAQLSFAPQKESRLTKPLQGHFSKSGSQPAKLLREVRLGQDDGDLAEGVSVSAEVFEGVGFVDVTAVGKGRGFQGVVKRWNFRGGRASHGGGNPRGGGSIGMCEYPARVLKGKKMPGQMGNRQVTVQNLKVVAIRAEDNALLVRGAVPGPNGGVVMVRKALKKAAK